MIQRFKSALFYCFSILLLLGSNSCNSNSSVLAPPTEAEVKQTIEKNFTGVYLQNDFNAIADKIYFDFSEVRIGDIMEKQMGLGELAQPVYPVKAPVNIRITYSNNPGERQVQRGKELNDVFFFYRDGFGDWTFRTGSM